MAKWVVPRKLQNLARQVRLAETLNELRKEGRFVDVFLYCDKEVINAHRVVVSARSAWLKRTLAKHETVSNLHVKHITPHLFEILVEYMYRSCGDLFRRLAADELFQLLVPARKLEIPGAVDDIYAAILEKSDINTILPLWHWAVDFGEYGAEQTVISCIVANFTVMLSANLFSTLSWEELCTIATHPEFDQKKYFYELASAVKQWLKTDPELKTYFASQLTKTLKLEIKTQRCLAEMMPNLVVVDTSLGKCVPKGKRKMQTKSETRVSQRKISNAVAAASGIYCMQGSSPKWSERRRKRIMNKSPELKLKSSSRPPEFKNTYQQSSFRSLMEQTKSGLFPSITVCGKTTRDSESETRPLIPKLRLDKLLSKNGIKHHDELLLLGLDRKRRVVLQCYLPTGNVWTVPQDMSIPFRCNFMCTYKHGVVYIAGGEDANGCKYAETFFYDLSRKQLSTGTNLRIARSDAGVAMCGENLYVIGGHNNAETTLSCVERLNTNNPKSEWRIMPRSLRKPCSSPGVVVNNEDKVFIIGGYSECCQCYIPAEEACIQLPALPETYRCCGLFSAIHKGEIYIFRRHRPLEFCIVNLEREEYRNVRTSGEPPEEMCNLVKMDDKFWAIDRYCKLFTLDIRHARWLVAGSCSKDIIKPLYLSVVHGTSGLGLKQKYL